MARVGPGAHRLAIFRVRCALPTSCPECQVRALIPHPLRRLALTILAAPLAAGLAGAQGAPKKELGVEDYTRWRAIEGAQISDDGNWVASTLRLTNVPQNESKPELHLRRHGTERDIVIAHASNAAFSNDSKWIVYQVDSMPARTGGRGGTPATPATPLRRYELRELATGATQVWKDIGSATFNTTSTHVFLRRREGGAAGGRGGRGAGGGGGGGFGGAAPGGDVGASSTAVRGTDVILVDLATGRSQLLGSVGDIAFNRPGDLLAYTVDAGVSDANGAFVIELPSGRVHALDNDTTRYSRLAWTADGSGLAFLKGTAVKGQRERTNVLLAFADVRRAFANPEAAPAVLDPKKTASWDAAWVLSERAPLAWSLDKQRVFFGAKAQVPQADTGRKPGTDSIADVDV